MTAAPGTKNKNEVACASRRKTCRRPPNRLAALLLGGLGGRFGVRRLGLGRLGLGRLGHLASGFASESNMARGMFTARVNISRGQAANTQAATAYCLAHPQWRLGLQTHKIVGIP